MFGPIKPQVMNEQTILSFAYFKSVNSCFLKKIFAVAFQFNFWNCLGYVCANVGPLVNFNLVPKLN